MSNSAYSTPRSYRSGKSVDLGGILKSRGKEKLDKNLTQA